MTMMVNVALECESLDVVHVLLLGLFGLEAILEAVSVVVVLELLLC